MNQKAKKSVAVMGINLVAATVAVAGTNQVAVHGEESKPTVTQLNEASKHSMENSWCIVPPVCKARLFKASPTVIETASVPASTLALFQQFAV